MLPDTLPIRGLLEQLLIGYLTQNDREEGTLDPHCPPWLLRTAAGKERWWQPWPGAPAFLQQVMSCLSPECLLEALLG